MSNHETIQITDFRLAGFLLARGARFQGTEVSDKGEVSFLFGADSEGSDPTALLNAYPGSTEQRYDAACRTMHDFTKLSVSRRGRGGANG